MDLARELARPPVDGARAEARPVSRRDFAIFVIVVLGLAQIVSGMTLTAFPDIHPDEAWYANLALNWLETGKAWTTVDIGPFDGGQGMGTTLLGAVPSRLAIELFGLNLQSLRLLSFLAGIGALATVAVVGAQLWSWRTGCLAAAALALQTVFLVSSHMSRPEVWLLLAAMLALAASLVGWRREQPLWDALAAVLAVGSVEIHQHGAVFAVALASTYLARYGRRAWREPGALYFGVVAGLGGSLVLVRTFGPGGQNAMSALGLGTSHSVPLFSSHPLSWPLKELGRYVAYFADAQLDALLIGLAVLLAVRRRTISDRIALSWLAGAAIGMMLLVSRVFIVYLLPMAGVAALLVGRGLAEVLELPGKWARQSVVLTVGVMLLPVLAQAAARAEDPMALQLELREEVACGRVLAPNQYWLAFRDCDFRSFDQVSHYHHVHGHSIEEAMAAIQPDYLIVDESIQRKLGDDFGAGGDMYTYYQMPESEFQQFLDERTLLVHSVIVPGRGAAEVREVAWGQ